MMMTKILMSLPSSFATEEDRKTLDNLRNRLMLEEKRVQMHGTTFGESALLAKKSNFKRFHNKNSSLKKNGVPGKCFNCGKGSHWRKDCPENKKRSESSRTDMNNALCCSTVDEVSLSIKINDDCIWFLDSGSTEHMASNREDFYNYTSFDEERKVRIGDGQFMKAIGIGDINVKAYDGEKWVSKFMYQVLHVPVLYSNLFSQGAMLDKGGRLVSDNRKCEFIRDDRIVAVGIRENRLYKVLIKTEEAQSNANIANKCDSLQLWHERLMHQHIGQVKKVLKNNHIDYANCEHIDCEACVFGKAHRLKFPERETKA